MRKGNLEQINRLKREAQMKIDKDIKDFIFSVFRKRKILLEFQDLMHETLI